MVLKGSCIQGSEKEKMGIVNCPWSEWLALDDCLLIINRYLTFSSQDLQNNFSNHRVQVLKILYDTFINVVVILSKIMLYSCYIFTIKTLEWQCNLHREKGLPQQFS